MRFLRRKGVEVDEEDVAEPDDVWDVNDPAYGSVRDTVGEDGAGGHHVLPPGHGEPDLPGGWADDQFDEYDEDDVARPSARRRWLLPAGLLLALALAAFLARGPIGDTLRPDRSEGSPTETSTAVALDGDRATLSSPVSAAAPSATPASPAATTAAPTASAPRAEVTTIQVVPAVRDVIVVANGTTYASEADGTIDLAENDRHGDVEIVGLTAQPALEQLTFLGWADGDLRTTRPLDSVDGPVAQLGFAVSVRVQATAGAIQAGGATIAFSSDAGPLVLTVGETAWVVRARATSGPDGLVEEPVVYTSVSLTRGPATVPLSAQTFTPAAEAFWTVVP